MFKKKPNIKPLAPLRSSDRRKLADQIIKDYGLEVEIPDEQTPDQKAETTSAHTNLRNSLLPDNAQSARFTTTQGPDLKQAAGTVYVGSHEGEEARILWFQIEGRMYPSVYTLWKNADIVPLLHTPGIVVKKLQGGADLMTPGLALGPPFPARAKKGAVAAIASTERPSVPIAVGWCEIDVGTLEKAQGAKGHAVRNMHWAGDEAWDYGASGRPGQEPPEVIEGWAKAVQGGDLSDRLDNLGLDNNGDGGVPLSEDVVEDETQKQANGSAAVTTAENGDGTEAEAKQLTQKEIDDAFRNAFLYGVHKYKMSNPETKNFSLVFPLSQSFVMSTLVQPYLPAFTPEQSLQLHIKKTSWKNIKKFIKSLDKEQIVKAKEKDGNEITILDIDFDDAAILDFKPYRLPKKETSGSAKVADGKEADGDDSVGQKLQVISYFKPTTKLQPLFSATTKQLFTPPEVRELVTSYLESENLISETNKRLVRLDPTLSNAVFDGSGSLDKEVLAKGSVPRDTLVDRVLHAMASSYAIIRNGADSNTVKAKSGAPPKVHITLETRSGNKTVTKVSGLEPYFVSPKLLADELRKVCAGSTSVEPLAGAAKKHEKPVEEVMVQGPQKDAVIKALEKRGLDRRWIDTIDKTKGKKKG